MKTKQAKRIRDLPDDFGSIAGVRFKYPADGKYYYWTSQWRKGVWGKKSIESSQIFPLFVNDLSEALEWELANQDEDETT